VNLHDQQLGNTFSPDFFAAMLHEGGRSEAESHEPVSLWDWVFTYIAY
jgi:hypothetical protein